MKHLSRYSKVSQSGGVAVAFAVVAVTAAACGSSDTNQQAKTAADHASYVENTRCAGVEESREADAIISGQSVSAVRPLYVAMDPSKSDVAEQLHGATVLVPAQPGMTAEWLNRVLECHSAQATLGQSQAPNDPFYLPDAVVDITVKPAKDGFAINVSTERTHDAQRVLDRANAWVQARGPAVSSR